MSSGLTMSTDKDESESGSKFFLCESTSIFSKLSVGVTFVSLIFQIVSVACPYWIIAEVRGKQAIHGGLWVECSLANIFTTREQWVCLSFSAAHHLEKLPRFLKAVQAMAILVLICLVTCTFLLALYAILPKLQGRKMALFSALGCVVFAALFGLIGGSVFAADYPTPQDLLGLHHWTFGFAFAFQWLVVALCLIVVVLIVVDMRSSLLIKSLRFF
ncbi:methionine synthase [Plakobranchus ocellatus]|uniref:Methionine synthase n=1 Tax=Plakobranchus ocellatus TaxID=259542 RepID=A0AAV4DP33_9GAST|nr:methionine synthase [Plakobranchus ocellatus]